LYYRNKYIYLEQKMGIIPPINPIFYLFLFLAFLLFVLALTILVRSKRARWGKALFFGCACLLLIVTIAYPIQLYSNKSAPLASFVVLIGQDHDGQIVALNARDGSVRWTHPLDTQTYISGGSDNLVYTVSKASDGTGIVTAYAASNGRQVWRSSLPLLPNGQQDSVTFSHVLVSDGRVYIDETLRSSNVVYALHTTDGSLVWKRVGQTTDDQEPFLITAGNGLLLVQTQDSGFSAWYASDGSLAWHFSPEGGFVHTYQQVLANQAVYFLQNTVPVSPNRHSSLLALSQRNGKVLWQDQLPGSNAAEISVSKLAVAGIHLYLHSYDLTLLNAFNGTQIWQDAGSRFAATTQGPPTVLDASAPTEVNGIVYVPRSGALNALDARNGRVLWRLPADPDGNFTTPVFSQNVLFTSANALPPFRYQAGSGQDAVVAINSFNGSVYWSTTNTADFVGIFNLS
jgi:outer membrane protein assembly factor BamB